MEMQSGPKIKSLHVNALLNAIQQVCAIIFPIITFPYITRVLGAENYGKVNFGYSIVQYFALIAALGISSYAVREGSRIRDDNKAISLFASELFSLNVITTIFSSVALLLVLFLADAFNDYHVLILIQGISIPLTTIGVAWVYSIFEDYLYITIRAVSVQVISLIFMFVFVKKPEDYVVYAAITTFAGGGANILNFIRARKYLHIKLTNKPNLKKHLMPIVVLFANSLAVVIYVNADTTMLKFMQGETAVGIYSAAVKVYTCIKQLLNAVLVVTVPRISYYLGKGEKSKYSSLLNEILSTLLMLLSPACVGLFVISKDLVPIIAGAEYASGFHALQILSVSIFFALLATFFSFSILIPNRQEKTVLKVTIVAAIINIGLNLILIPKFSFNGAAITTLIAEFVVALFSFLECRKFSKLILDKRVLYISVIGSLLIIAICFLFETLVNNVILRLICSITLSVIGYGVVMMCFGFNPIKRIRKIIKR